MITQKCPVCGMEISNSTITATFKGRQYEFCCPECKRRFQGDPVKFAVKP